ncbi:unnamed protein product [Amoebophrya sp. A120]|nr:unnamed protein product [Amoebophrya sp. A120]|eukprot:GSA120T00012625001.1
MGASKNKHTVEAARRTPVGAVSCFHPAEDDDQHHDDAAGALHNRCYANHGTTSTPKHDRPAQHLRQQQQLHNSTSRKRKRTYKYDHPQYQAALEKIAARKGSDANGGFTWFWQQPSCGMMMWKFFFLSCAILNQPLPWPLMVLDNVMEDLFDLDVEADKDPTTSRSGEKTKSKSLLQHQQESELYHDESYDGGTRTTKDFYSTTVEKAEECSSHQPAPAPTPSRQPRPAGALICETSRKGTTTCTAQTESEFLSGRSTTASSSKRGGPRQQDENTSDNISQSHQLHGGKTCARPASTRWSSTRKSSESVHPASSGTTTKNGWNKETLNFEHMVQDQQAQQHTFSDITNIRKPDFVIDEKLDLQRINAGQPARGLDHEKGAAVNPREDVDMRGTNTLRTKRTSNSKQSYLQLKQQEDETPANGMASPKTSSSRSTGGDIEKCATSSSSRAAETTKQSCPSGGTTMGFTDVQTTSSSTPGRAPATGATCVRPPALDKTSKQNTADRKVLRNLYGTIRRCEKSFLLPSDEQDLFTMGVESKKKKNGQGEGRQNVNGIAETSKLHEEDKKADQEQQVLDTGGEDNYDYVDDILRGLDRGFLFLNKNGQRFPDGIKVPEDETNCDWLFCISEAVRPMQHSYSLTKKPLAPERSSATDGDYYVEELLKKILSLADTRKDRAQCNNGTASSISAPTVRDEKYEHHQQVQLELDQTSSKVATPLIPSSKQEEREQQEQELFVFDQLQHPYDETRVVVEEDVSTVTQQEEITTSAEQEGQKIEPTTDTVSTLPLPRPMARADRRRSARLLEIEMVRTYVAIFDAPPSLTEEYIQVGVTNKAGKAKVLEKIMGADWYGYLKMPKVLLEMAPDMTYLEYASEASLLEIEIEDINTAETSSSSSTVEHDDHQHHHASRSKAHDSIRYNNENHAADVDVLSLSDMKSLLSNDRYGYRSSGLSYNIASAAARQSWCYSNRYKCIYLIDRGPEQHTDFLLAIMLPNLESVAVSLDIIQRKVYDWLYWLQKLDQVDVDEVNNMEKRDDQEHVGGPGRRADSTGNGSTCSSTCPSSSEMKQDPFSGRPSHNFFFDDQGKCSSSTGSRHHSQQTASVVSTSRSVQVKEVVEIETQTPKTSFSDGRRGCRCAASTTGAADKQLQGVDLHGDEVGTSQDEQLQYYTDREAATVAKLSENDREHIEQTFEEVKEMMLMQRTYKARSDEARGVDRSDIDPVALERDVQHHARFGAVRWREQRKALQVLDGFVQELRQDVHDATKVILKSALAKSARISALLTLMKGASALLAGLLSNHLITLQSTELQIEVPREHRVSFLYLKTDFHGMLTIEGGPPHFNTLASVAPFLRIPPSLLGPLSLIGAISASRRQQLRDHRAEQAVSVHHHQADEGDAGSTKERHRRHSSTHGLSFAAHVVEDEQNKLSSRSSKTEESAADVHYNSWPGKTAEHDDLGCTRTDAVDNSYDHKQQPAMMNHHHGRDEQHDDAGAARDQDVDDVPSGPAPTSSTSPTSQSEITTSTEDDNLGGTSSSHSSVKSTTSPPAEQNRNSQSIFSRRPRKNSRGGGILLSVTATPVDDVVVAAAGAAAPPAPPSVPLRQAAAHTSTATATTTSCDPLGGFCDVYESLESFYPPQVSPHCLQSACEIPAQSGEFIGACQNSEYIQSQISFCRSRVCYDACVPPIQYIHPEWTLREKDRLVEKRFKALIEERIRREVNASVDPEVPMLFTYNADCIEAFKDALCYLNFPKCGCAQESLPMCTSVCNNYYTACGGAIPNEDGTFIECTEGFILDAGLFASYTNKRRPNATSTVSRDGLMRNNWDGPGFAAHALGGYTEQCPAISSDMRQLRSVSSTRQHWMTSHPSAGSAGGRNLAASASGPTLYNNMTDAPPFSGGGRRLSRQEAVMDRNHRMLQQTTQACRDASMNDTSAVGGGTNPDNLQVSAVEKPEDPDLLPAVLCVLGLFLLVIFSYVMSFVEPSFDANKRIVKIIATPIAFLAIVFLIQYVQLTLEAGKVASPDGTPVVLACIEGKVRVSGDCARRLRWPQVTQLGCSTSCTGNTVSSRVVGAASSLLLLVLSGLYLAAV